MIISRIELNNFRVYYGKNELNFSVDKERNVSIIAGNNGYGKTSLLTALVWGLYGKMIVDVDDHYRKDIYNCGGYRKYCDKLMNWKAVESVQQEVKELAKRLNTVNAIEKRQVDAKIKELQSFSVTIQFNQLFIPHVPCRDVVVSRSYNVFTQQEELEILVDGKQNELTKEIGKDIFVNEFILPKEIAKFFFFDAEKIVSMAEISSADEKKAISYAYSEVLGVKKYADLKESLENMRLRLRNKSSDKEDRVKLNRANKEKEQLEKTILHIRDMIEEKKEELYLRKNQADKLQEQLIREGVGVSIEEVKNYKKNQTALEQQGQLLKDRLFELMELVPFAIAGKKMDEVKEQLETEFEKADKLNTGKLLGRKAAKIENEIARQKRKLGLDKEKEALLLTIIREHLSSKHKGSDKVLLKFTEDQYNHFNALYANLGDSFSRSFRQISSDMKRQQSSLMQLRRRLQDAESKENDAVIRLIRQDKQKLESSIQKTEDELIRLEARLLQQQHELSSRQKVLNELAKRIRIEDRDKAKDETAGRLIEELTSFIRQLKLKKKSALETNVQAELNRLMHKKNFVKRVNAVIEGDLIDIELYDAKNQLVSKEGLSKGEQQLYATALLKALITESSIKFPVFIDSPLQKFDKEHSRNIVRDFYPHVSEQVVLFPLPEKELTEAEYSLLLPHIANVYIISNRDHYSSQFRMITPSKLFEDFRKETGYVYEH